MRIKTEPGYENGAQSYSAGVNGYTTNGATIAQQRAANLLQQQYGGQTSPSMSHGMPQQQPGFALPGQPRPAGIQLPGQPQRPAQQQQYPPQQPQAPQQQRTPLSAAQTDGADGDAAEWRAIVAQNRSRSDTDRIGADAQIKNQIDQMTYQMDSGLMVPLAEQPRNPNRKRKLPAGNAPWSLDPSQPSTLPSIPQLDGVDEDDEDEEKPVFKEEEKDEDAINSDLDDSEDELNQVEADEDEGAAVNEAILCTYDKVQRVKNKWKCTLKDGILSTKGKEYVHTTHHTQDSANNQQLPLPQGTR